jgi:protocatechuate 3,4-dioxygenase, beta subunit
MSTIVPFSRRHAIFALALGGASACTSRAAPREAARADLYACEGCEAATERPPETLASSAQVAGPDEPGERLILEGRVTAADGITPAPGVVIYAHQTDATGVYRGAREGGRASERNGVLKAWLKTGADGRYRFDTIKPAPYPGGTMPAHIHLYVWEPGRRPYYIDDVVFAGEPMVDERYRARQELRGGSGIVTLARGNDGILLATRDIVLERHPQ